MAGIDEVGKAAAPLEVVEAAEATEKGTKIWMETPFCGGDGKAGWGNVCSSGVPGNPQISGILNHAGRLFVRKSAFSPKTTGFLP